MRSFAESEDGKRFFGFIRQTVRFPSISAIGDMSSGQVEYLRKSIAVQNKVVDDLKKDADKQDEIDVEKREMEKAINDLDTFTNKFLNNLNSGNEY